MNSLLPKKDISKVFIFTRGPYYWTGYEPSGDSKNKKILTDIDSYFRGAQKTINKIAGSGKQVYFVTENPELKLSAKACFTRPFRKKQKTCYVEKSDVIERFKDYTHNVKKIKNAKIINSISAFCPKSSCLIFDKDGGILYADDDHHSVAGSHFQVENLLLPYLKQ